MTARLVSMVSSLLLLGWLPAAALPAESGGTAAAEASRPPAIRLLPENTSAVVIVKSVPELSKRFVNTASGRMGQDPQVQPYVKHLYGTLVEAVAKYQDRIDLGLPDLLSLPQGELAIGLVTPDDQPPALVLLLETGEKSPDALRLLQRGGQTLEKSGAKKSEEDVSGVKLTIYDGLGSQNQRRAVWFQKGSTFVVGTSLEVLKRVLAAWDGQASGCLAENKKFGAILAKCRGGRDEDPQVTAFVDPIALLRAFGRDNPQSQLVLAMLPVLGLDGLLAAGAAMTFDAGPFDSIVQLHVLLDNPRSGVLDMLAFESGDTRPEPWAPGDAATYLTVHWNFARTYKTGTKLYDSIRGEGALARLLDRRVQEPLGIDLAKDVLPFLDGRVTYLTRIDHAAAVQGQRFLIGLKLKDPAEIAKTLEAARVKNEQALTVVTEGERKYYQFRRPNAKPDAADQPRPSPCFGILDDYLLFADRPETYLKAATTRDNPSEGLAETLDFKLVASRIARRSGSTKPALLRFDRPEEGMRFMYDLAASPATRDQLKRAADRGNPMAKAFSGALETQALPPFSVFQKYLAPGGALLVDDETGLHYTAFTLRRK